MSRSETDVNPYPGSVNASFLYLNWPPALRLSPVMEELVECLTNNPEAADSTSAKGS